MEVLPGICGVIWCRNRRLKGVSSGKKYPTRPKHLAGAPGKRWIGMQLIKNMLVPQGVKVKSLNMSDIGEPGLMSDIKVVDLSYSDGREDASRPRQLLAKFAPTSFKTRITTDLLEFGKNEFTFYTQLLPSTGGPDNFPGVRPPACYGGDYNHTSKNFVILLEYLKDAEFPDQMGPELPVEELQLIIRSVAQLHAHWLGTGCHDIPWAPRMDEPVIKLAVVELKRHWPKIVKISRRNRRAARKQQQLADTWTFQVPKSALELMPKLQPILFEFSQHVARNCKNLETLQHGDTRLDNFYFIGKDKQAGQAETPQAEHGGKERRIGLIDWQLVNVAIAPADLAYFLAGACKTETIEQHEPMIAAAYLDELRKQAPDASQNFTVEEWDECYNLAIIGQACKVAIGIGGVDSSDLRSLQVLDMLFTNTFKLWELRGCSETLEKYLRGELLSQNKAIAASALSNQKP